MAYPEFQKQVEIRKSILESLFKAGGGHYGGALSVVDILLVLYGEILGETALSSQDPKRDRVILSKGHSAIALYAVLDSFGVLGEVDLGRYGKYGSRLEGHPDMTQTAGIDFSSGSLGQGISAGLGMAFSLRQQDAHVWVVVGDGECQEGQTWEAALLAARYKVSNLHVIVDANGAQELGWAHDATLDQEPMPRMVEKWEAFGWTVRETDGHDYSGLERTCREMRANGPAPSVIIARTTKGKGVAAAERNPGRYHCVCLDETEHRTLVESIYM